MSSSICDRLGYQLPTTNALHRGLRGIASSRGGAWLFARTMPRIDRFLLRLTRGRRSLPELIAALPVVTLVTTGAKSGLVRTTPLLAVPHGDDVAVIGTQFGQPGTPSWYFNLVADPSAELRYHGQSVAVTAHEVEGPQRDEIWQRACEFYTGYAAYARRIKDSRPIHIMVLTASS